MDTIVALGIVRCSECGRILASDLESWVYFGSNRQEHLVEMYRTVRDLNKKGVIVIDTFCPACIELITERQGVIDAIVHRRIAR